MITKENEDFNFKFIKSYEIDNIFNHVKKFSNEWYYNTSRQEDYDVHKFTTSYFIYEHSNNWTYGEPYNTKLVCDDLEFLKMISPIIKELETMYDGKVGKALFINLPAGKEVLSHKDSGDYLGMSRRIHIPIITNSDVDFIINNEAINMKYGECWEINNNKYHYVNNRSTQDRVHLLIDILPNSFFQEQI
jgi:aspartyl/asparaginyl beta-hydroxylase (cupin superfamily)